MHKVVVFSADLSYSVRKGIVEIDRRLGNIEWLIMKHTPPRRVGQLLRNQIRNLRRNGWRWIPSQVSEFTAALWARLATYDSSKTYSTIGSRYTLESLLAQPNVRYVETPDVNGLSAVEEVRRFSPDLGISLAAPILKAPTFGACRLGTINLHKGRVPDYRGMPPAFWELWNDEDEVGCTVHRVTAGLDTGDVLVETRVPRHKYSTVKGLQLTLDEAGVELTCEAVERILSGAAVYSTQKPGGRTFTKPTIKQVGELRRRLKGLLPANEGSVKKAAKHIYLLGCLYGLRPWRRLTWRKPTVTVLLYHRVSDQLRDSLTVGIEQFDRQMALLRRSCQVLSIDEVVRGAVPRHPSKPLVCVTFDDGYADNYHLAVPILIRNQIPAAFFVSTGIIGSSRTFPHDSGKVPHRLENMAWGDLEHMRTEGFTIGSHTVNHIDCAKEAENVVRDELRQSLEHLRSRLGISDVILAYPFGGRQNMTPERLEIVRQTGYVGCLSAYGGFNHGHVDQFNVLRCGVNWAFSELAFRCRALGLH